MSSFGRLARRPKYDISYSFLIAHVYFGRLARRPKELVKFATFLGEGRWRKGTSPGPPLGPLGPLGSRLASEQQGAGKSRRTRLKETISAFLKDGRGDGKDNPQRGFYFKVKTELKIIHKEVFTLK